MTRPLLLWLEVWVKGRIPTYWMAERSRGRSFGFTTAWRGLWPSRSKARAVTNLPPRDHGRKCNVKLWRTVDSRCHHTVLSESATYSFFNNTWGNESRTRGTRHRSTTANNRNDRWTHAAYTTHTDTSTPCWVHERPIRARQQIVFINVFKYFLA